MLSVPREPDVKPVSNVRDVTRYHETAQNITNEPTSAYWMARNCTQYHQISRNRRGPTSVPFDVGALVRQGGDWPLGVV